MDFYLDDCADSNRLVVLLEQAGHAIGTASGRRGSKEAPVTIDRGKEPRKEERLVSDCSFDRHGFFSSLQPMFFFLVPGSAIAGAKVADVGEVKAAGTIDGLAKRVATL